MCNGQCAGFVKVFNWINGHHTSLYSLCRRFKALWRCVRMSARMWCIDTRKWSKVSLNYISWVRAGAVANDGKVALVPRLGRPIQWMERRHKGTICQLERGEPRDRNRISEEEGQRAGGWRTIRQFRWPRWFLPHLQVSLVLKNFLVKLVIIS